MQERISIAYHPIAGPNPSTFSFRAGPSGSPVTLYAPSMRRMGLVSQIPDGVHPGALVDFLADDPTVLLPGNADYTRNLQELYAAVQRKSIAAWHISSEFYAGYLMAVYRWRTVLCEMVHIDRTVSHSRAQRFWELLSKHLDAPVLALFSDDGTFSNARMLIPCPTVQNMDMERVLMGWSYGISRMFTHLVLFLGGYDSLTLSETVIARLQFEGMYELRRSAEADNISYSMLDRAVEDIFRDTMI